MKENDNKEARDNVINLNEASRQELKFGLRVLPIIKNGQLRHYIYIIEEDRYGNKKNSVYSDYFFSRVLGKSMLNLSLNTKKNFNARFIVMFLNYIFNEMDDAISNIEDLTIDHVRDFLERYSSGQLGRNKCNKDDLTGDRNHILIICENPQYAAFKANDNSCNYHC